MAGGSLFTLLDDIASILDDVATMTKVATKKTAGVLGDDLALNAQQVSGIRADRELPVVWAVAKGSARNKLILIPAALAISVVLPWAVTVLLMIGGAYLCYEGVEKLVHRFLHGKEEEEHHKEHLAAFVDPARSPVEVEKEKIRGAVRTDFVLSAEIIVIALGTVAEAPILQRVAVLIGIGIIMTVGVYGLVAGIVKLDDLGLHLSRKEGGLARPIGRGILKLAPWLMKGLSIAGTAAMFLVGGGILTHGIPGAHDVIHHVAHAAGTVPGVGGLLEALTPPLLDGATGIVAGAVVLLAAGAVKRLVRRPAAPQVSGE